MQQAKVILVPCSGIGKSYGTVAREAVYITHEDLRQEATEIIPLALLVMGDADSRQVLSGCPVISVDGCKLNCASKMVQEYGGRLSASFAVLEVFRRYRAFKPQGIAELNEGGQKLAQALAEEIAQAVDQAREEGDEHA